MSFLASSGWWCWVPVGLFLALWVVSLIQEERKRSREREVERLRQEEETKKREYEEALISTAEAKSAAAEILCKANEACLAIVANARRVHPLIKFRPYEGDPRLEEIVAESLSRNCKRRELEAKKAESRSEICNAYRKQLCSEFKNHESTLAVREILKGSHGPDDFWENEERHRKTTRGTEAEDWSLRRQAVHSRDHGMCLRCGGRVTVEECHVHHMKKSKHGGTNALENLATLCRDCHCMMPGHEHMRVRISYALFEGVLHRKSCSRLPQKTVTVKKSKWNWRQRRWGKRKRNVEVQRPDLEGLETFPFNIAVERGHSSSCPVCKPDEQYEKLLTNWLPSTLRERL
jgi:HNH endonuclease